MDSSLEDSVNPRFYDFKKRPYDAVNPRLTYQFWPAFLSKLKRKGLSSVMDLRFNSFPTEPTASIRRIKHDDALAKRRLTQYETEYDAFLLTSSAEPNLDLLRFFWTYYVSLLKRSWKNMPRLQIRRWAFSMQ